MTNKNTPKPAVVKPTPTKPPGSLLDCKRVVQVVSLATHGAPPSVLVRESKSPGFDPAVSRAANQSQKSG